MHIDRAASAWLIRRLVDPRSTFGFVSDPADVPEGAVPFDVRGVEFGHHGQDCTFETLLRRHDLIDPVLWRIAAIVHEADIEDDRCDAPEAPGLDVILRGLSMITDDQQVLAVTASMFDGLNAYFRRALMLGRDRTEHDQPPPRCRRGSSPIGVQPGRDPFRSAVKAWFLISLQTFGGPAGQIAVMHRTWSMKNAGSGNAGSCTP